MKRDPRGPSRAAVAVAGTRERRKPSESAGSWTTQRGKLPETETFRPGKTRRARGGK